ncbi:MAG: MFS transporter [Clostridiales bacterium]|nr:MFS transporter [Clostridiales bacterium]
MQSESLKSTQRTLTVLLVFTFFMVLGFEMIMPLIIGHFVNDLLFSAAAVSLALAIRQFSQQGLAVVGGALADRYNIRILICFGVLLRAAGFAALAFADNYMVLLASMIVIGFGGVLFETPYQTAMALLTTEDNRSRYYSLYNTVVGVSGTAGPLVGVLLLKLDFSMVCFGAAACFLVCFVIACFTMPKAIRAQVAIPITDSVKTVIKDGRFLKFAVLMMVFWLSASQINVSFPLKAQDITGNENGVGVMWAIYAAVNGALQYPLVSLMLKKYNPRQIAVFGITLNTIALILAAFADTHLLFYAAVVIFALGMLFARPNQQSLAVAMADSKAMGMYIGVTSLTFAIGNGTGTIIGGALYDLAKRTGYIKFPWFIYAAVSVASLLGFAFSKWLDVGHKNGSEVCGASSAAETGE